MLITTIRESIKLDKNYGKIYRMIKRGRKKMTSDEKIELGTLLDKHRVKTVFYSEQLVEYGVYQILHYNDQNKIKEVRIFRNEQGDIVG